MQNKRIVVLPLLIIITLSIFGFVYAHWSDMVTIKGEVEMGSVTLAFDKDEFLVWADTESTYPVFKDVGYANMTYDETSLVQDVHTGKWGYKTLILQIYNAYPQYEVHFTTVTVHNIGTMPLHITNITLWDPTDELNWTWDVKPPTTPCNGTFWKDGLVNDNDVYDDGEEVMNVLIKNFVCIQLEPCESTKGEVDIDFKQPAEECHTYSFAISIEAVQYDKA